MSTGNCDLGDAVRNDGLPGTIRRFLVGTSRSKFEPLACQSIDQQPPEDAIPLCCY